MEIFHLVIHQNCTYNQFRSEFISLNLNISFFSYLNRLICCSCTYIQQDSFNFKNTSELFKNHHLKFILGRQFETPLLHNHLYLHCYSADKIKLKLYFDAFYEAYIINYQLSFFSF